MKLVFSLVASAAAFDIDVNSFGAPRIGQSFSQAPARHLTSNPFREDACKECIITGAKWIMDKEFAAADYWCSHEEDTCESQLKCDKKKEFCYHWKNDREVMEGILIEKTRPMSISHAYCVGTGTCKKADENGKLPSVAEILELNGESGKSYKFLEPGLDKQMEDLMEADYLLSTFDGEGYGEYFHTFFGRISGFFHHIFAEITGKPEVKPEKQDMAIHMAGICPHCYHKTVKVLMGHVTTEVKKICANPPCKPMAAWCSWAGEHPGMAFGMLLGKVEPWKYAIGRCWHPHKPNNSLPFFRHEKHGKGEGKGKGDSVKGKGKGADDEAHIDEVWN